MESKPVSGPSPREQAGVVVALRVDMVLHRPAQLRVQPAQEQQRIRFVLALFFRRHAFAEQRLLEDGRRFLARRLRLRHVIQRMVGHASADGVEISRPAIPAPAADRRNDASSRCPPLRRASANNREMPARLISSALSGRKEGSTRNPKLRSLRCSSSDTPANPPDRPSCRRLRTPARGSSPARQKPPPCSLAFAFSQMAGAFRSLISSSMPNSRRSSRCDQ